MGYFGLDKSTTHMQLSRKCLTETVSNQLMNKEQYLAAHPILSIWWEVKNVLYCVNRGFIVLQLCFQEVVSNLII